MRKGVDHIGVGVGGVILSSDGRVFLARRGAAARNERHCWEFPGGSVEFGERLTDALTREIREEYGIEIEVVRLLDVVDHLIPEEGQHWVSPTYLCRHLGGSPRIQEPGKCEEIGWFRVQDIPLDSLSRASRHSLESLVRHLAQTGGDGSP